jgi:hypothetical protein
VEAATFGLKAASESGQELTGLRVRSENNIALPGRALMSASG